MAALTQSRNTKKWGLLPVIEVRTLGVKAATKCYQGGIAVNDAGTAAPGRTATGLKALGIFKYTYDNSAGIAKAIQAEILCGVFKFANSSAGDLITDADVGFECYIVDDQTVAKTSATNTRTIAGLVEKVESDGVYVRFI